MKKLILVLALTLSFCTHGIAKGFDAESIRPIIKMFEQQIKNLRVNRSNLKQQLFPIQQELELASKKKTELKSKFRSLASNPKVNTSTYLETKREKFNTRLNITSLFSEQIDLLFNITKINLEIDKINTLILTTEMLAEENQKNPT